MTGARGFYDDLAETYHLLYADWDASIPRQASALDGVIRRELGPGPHTILDCACGIGTQALGLAALGHGVIATDLSPDAVARTAREARARDLTLPTAAADLRALPFRPAYFDVVLCADNALPHLLTPADQRVALTNLRRVLRPGGLLIITTRPYDSLRATRPLSTPPQITGRTITFQLWHWHDDGERYDVELFQLTGFVDEAGFTGTTWHQPSETGFFQPVLTARETTTRGF